MTYPIINGHPATMDHYDQIEVAAYLACELNSAMETWDQRGLTWERMGELLEEAHGHFGSLKALIHREFGTQLPAKGARP